MMKKLYCVMLAAHLVCGAMAQKNTAIQQYVDTYKEIAINEMIRSGVPASIT